MKAALFAYSRRGMETGRKVCRALTDEVSCYAPERLAGEGYAPIPKPSRDFYGEKFRESELLVFVGSCGIAVREIAPFVASKTSDPAVVCLDEGGNFRDFPALRAHWRGQRPDPAAGGSSWGPPR